MRYQAIKINRRTFGITLATGLLAGTRLGAAAQTPAASPAATPLASPAATSGTTAAPGSLAAMLAMVPDVFGGSPSQQATQQVVYANIAAQLATMQVPSPASIDQAGYPFTAVLVGLFLPDPLASHFLDPQWQTLFGFSPLDVDQAMQAGSPPNLITLFRGRFKDAEIVAALTKSGYKSVAVGNLTAYSLHEDASLDVANPVSQLALSRMNNGIRLPDGTWAFTATLATLRSVLAASQGQAASLARRADVQAALAVPSSELASAVLVAGAALQMNAVDMLGPQANATALAQVQHAFDQYGTMPPVGLALLATTVGGPLPPPSGGATPFVPSSPSIQPVSQAEITLVMATPAAAQSAVPVIEKRLAGMKSFRTQQLYTDIFPSPAVEAVAGQPVVRLTLLPKDRPSSVVFQMLFARDLAFIAW